MPKIDRILCPIDFSEASAKAYDYAYSLALRYEARLYVVNVIDILTGALPYYNGPALLTDSFYDQLGKDAEKRLQAMVSEPSRKGVPTETAVLRGFIPDSILTFAGEQRVALIVMGTHGRRGMNRLMMGSVTERVLRHAPSPVLAVRKPAHDFVNPQQPLEPVRLQKILLCTDFSKCAGVALQYALSLAQEYNAELTLLHVLEQSPAGKADAAAADARQRLESLVPEDAQDWCTVKTEVRAGGKPYREIIRIAEERPSDLVVLGVRGRGAMDLVVFGSTTNRVLQLGPCPVLVVPDSTHR